jgi:hypothetical protein
MWLFGEPILPGVTPINGMGDTGSEQTENTAVNPHISQQPAANSAATSDGLAEIVALWVKLPESIRASLLTIARASAGGGAA